MRDAIANKFQEISAGWREDGSIPNIKLSFGVAGFVSGSDGPDIVLAFAANTFAFGGGGDDVMIALGGAAFFRGGDGDDLLIGGARADTLMGDDGNDTLVLGAGDTGVGGTGADEFVFNVAEAGILRISDFDADEGDTLVFDQDADAAFKVVAAANHTKLLFDTGAELEFFGLSVADVLALMGADDPEIPMLDIADAIA